MLRGDWVSPHLLLEKGFGGIVQDRLLMIPKVEAECSQEPAHRRGRRLNGTTTC